jgi:prepilin-type N-terminal cleavage/methylation domain-containing protein
MNSKRSRQGFTLIELLIGIAVSSILLVGLFQLLTELTMLRRQFATSSSKTHQQVTLTRVLDQDLTALPMSKANFIGRRREFYRTTVAHAPNRNLRMETRVHYFIRAQNNRMALLREARWVDMQNRFGEPEVLYSASSIRFQYRTVNNRTVRSLSENETAAFVTIELPDNTITIPLGRRPDRSEQQEQTTPTPN